MDNETSNKDMVENKGDVEIYTCKPFHFYSVSDSSDPVQCLSQGKLSSQSCA